MKKLALHWQILIGMVAGLLIGVGCSYLGWSAWVKDWISPFGTIFINLLKLIAIPLIVVSLIKGIANLKDISKLSRIGTKTIGIYLVTTVFAVSIGLLMVNYFQPGNSFPAEKKEAFKQEFAEKVEQKSKDAKNVSTKGPLQFVVDMVPSNIFQSLSSNRDMLKVIFFTIFFAICLLLIDPKNASPVKHFFDGLNDVIMKMIDLIMKAAPVGVFALMAGLVADFAGDEPSEAISLLKVLGYYGFVVVAGLAVMMFLFYPNVLKILTGYSYKRFFKGISPAQLLAFSTSSSAATLPVTMECVEKKLGVSKQVTSFVLPIGATVNMDGTSLYQAVAAVFIAQAFGYDLSLANQITIVATATLASIGAAAVPGAGTVMLVIVLEAIGVPAEGIALVFAVDRPLDMMRTSVNVTGDATVALLVDKMEGKKKMA